MTMEYSDVLLHCRLNNSRQSDNSLIVVCRQAAVALFGAVLLVLRVFLIP